MRIIIALTYFSVATFLLSCDRQQASTDIDPKLGRECFENRRASLSPGTQYEGIDAVTEDRITIKIMNGVNVTTVGCGLNPDGTLESTDSSSSVE